MYVCDNCGKRYEREADFTHFFPNIPDLYRRLDIGGTVPAAECPECGALVYPASPGSASAMLLDCESCWTHSIPIEDCAGDRCPVCGSSVLMMEQGEDFDPAIWGGGHGKQYQPNIPDLHRRLKPIRLLILLEGGLVQDVLADKPGFEVAVLDQDIEGADEDEIVEVIGEIGRLRGTLQAHEVIIAPILMESAARSL